MKKLRVFWWGLFCSFYLIPFHVHNYPTSKQKRIEEKNKPPKLSFSTTSMIWSNKKSFLFDPLKTLEEYNNREMLTSYMYFYGTDCTDSLESLLLINCSFT